MKFRNYNPLLGCLGKSCTGLGSANPDLSTALTQPSNQTDPIDHALDMSPAVPGEPESEKQVAAAKAAAAKTAAAKAAAAKVAAAKAAAAKTDWGKIVLWGLLLGGISGGVWYFGFRKK